MYVDFCRRLGVTHCIPLALDTHSAAGIWRGPWTCPSSIFQTGTNAWCCLGHVPIPILSGNNIFYVKSQYIWLAWLLQLASTSIILIRFLTHTHIIGNYWWFTSKSPKSLHFFLNLRPNPLTDLEAGGLHARLVRLCRVRRSRRGGRGAEFGVAWDGAQGIAGTGEDWLQTYLQLGWCWDVGLDGETCKKHVYNLYSWCFEVIQLRYWWFIFG